VLRVRRWQAGNGAARRRGHGLRRVSGEHALDSGGRKLLGMPAAQSVAAGLCEHQQLQL
jgi:hypothetical protein